MRKLSRRRPVSTRAITEEEVLLHTKIAKALVAVFMIATALSVSSGTAAAAPVAPLALTPVNCSTDGAIRVNVPYYPNTYCYRGVGQRQVNLTQVHSVQAGNWTVTVIWRPRGGSWRSNGLTSGETLYIWGGDVNTLSVP
jgi:hypothetical protein